MTVSKLSSLCLIAGLLALSAPAVSQNPQQMLQNNPAMLQQLRQRILTSGLTPDQVRARLRAEGYPENLLDAYLPGSMATAADVGAPSPQVFSAITALGIADPADVATMRCGIESEPITPDTLPSSAAETLNRQATRLRCLAREDSIIRGLKHSQADIDSGFVIFGLDFFRERTTQFNPNQAGPVDASYMIHPGDELVLVLTGDVEQSYTLPVTREGFIVIPQVGQIWVNNITMADLENTLYQRLGRVYSGVRRGPGATTHFYVTPSRLGSNQIFVTGDVLRPGSYRISSAGTALTALYAALGPSENGSLRQVLIRRVGAAVDTLDVYDYLLNGNT
jgi:polysaccharide export outer membrane protein